jgi:predicted lipid-binding transport protein (Tim44 family)
MKKYYFLLLFPLLYFLASFKTETQQSFFINKKLKTEIRLDSQSKKPEILIEKENMQALGDSTIKDQIKNQKEIERYANFGAIMGGITIFLLITILISTSFGSSFGGIAGLGLLFSIPSGLISGLLTIKKTKNNPRSTFAIFSSLLGFAAFMVTLIIGLRSCGE